MPSRYTLLWLVLLLFQVRADEDNITKIKGRDLNIYVRQHQTFEVSNNFEYGQSPSSECKFIPRRPELIQAWSKEIRPTFKQAPHETLLQQIRTTESIGAEDMVMLKDYIFILNPNGSVTTMTYNSSIIGETHSYAIEEMPQGLVPFKFNNEAIIVTHDRIIRCSVAGYHSIPRNQSSRSMGLGLQIAPNEFILVNGEEIELFIENPSDQNFTSRLFVDNQRITERYPHAKNIRWEMCRKQSEYQLYCLESYNGIFHFQLPSANFNLVQSRSSCYNFMMSTKRQLISSCIYNNRNYLYNPTHEDKLHPSQFFARDMFALKDIGDYYISVSKSAIHFMNAKYPEYDHKIEYKEPVVRVLPWYGTNQSGFVPIEFYVLYKTKITKFLYKPGKNKIECYSDTPVNKQVKVYLKLSHGETQVMPVHLTIRESLQGHSLKLGIFVVFGIVLLVSIFIFTLIVCYYKKIEDRLQRIYRDIKERTGKKTKFVQEAA